MIGIYRSACISNTFICTRVVFSIRELNQQKFNLIGYGILEQMTTIRDLRSFMPRHGLQQILSEPTAITKHHNSCINYLFVISKNNFISKYGIYNLGITAHNLIIHTIDLSANTVLKQEILCAATNKYCFYKNLNN